ncbi:MAG TPA: metal-dependent transcriptional regulator [Anaerolineales bacterium]|nr:metal-dependent transcriptional regulator [Anaerolineales bacterium]
MADRLTYAVEDYLKTIYKLTRNTARASTNDIAEELRVSAASVTGMLQKLSSTSPPLVDYKKHYGAALTEEGEKVALETLRHHRLIELFLHQILGYDWENVHQEAERLEHVISEEFEEAIAQALGNPALDPHGDPIPSRDLQMPPSPSVRLADLEPGQEARVQRARDDDPDLLKYLRQIGLVPGVKVKVLSLSRYDELLEISVSGRGEPVVLGPKAAKQIFVEMI